MDNQNNGQDLNNLLNDLPKSNLDGIEIINPIQSVVNESTSNNDNFQNPNISQEQSINQETSQEQNVNQVNEQPQVEKQTEETISTGSNDIYYGPKNTAPIIDIESNRSDLPKFNNNAATIGKIKPDKQKSPFAMFFLFIILGAFIIFMPEAIKLANKYLGTNLNANDGVNYESDTTKPNNDVVEDDGTRIYTIANTLSIKLDKIILNNFEKIQQGENYVLNFNIQNPTNSEYQFNKKLYLDFYNSGNTFMIRRLVKTNNLLANGSMAASVNINKEVFDTGSKVEGALRTVDDYPNITLVDNKLTCSKGRRVLTFSFNNNKLTRINDYNIYTKSSDLQTFNEDYMAKKQMISSMDSVDGVDAILTENDSEYSTTITVNYEKASYNNLTYKDDYFERDTLSKQISFELTSMEYLCS